MLSSGHAPPPFHNGDWSDYVYAGSRLIARADDYEDRIQVVGDQCSGCYSQWYQFSFPNTGVLDGTYTIQSGDKLYWRQWQDTSTTSGGLNMMFVGGGSTVADGLLDQDGMGINADTTLWTWHYRKVDLSPEAGQTVSGLSLSIGANNLPGHWNVLYQSIVLVSSDGTVHPIYDRAQSVSLSGSGSSGMSGIGNGINHCSCFGTFPEETTTYYHGDHLGSARMMTNYNGYPTWSATYAPFGMELSAQPTVNHYKFTGKERDSESGLDDFGARYYSSQYGRFMTPDWSDRPTAVPYAVFGDPQSLNLYGYVRNDPVTRADLDGHCSQPDSNACPPPQSAQQLLDEQQREQRPHYIEDQGQAKAQQPPQQPSPVVVEVSNTTHPAPLNPGVVERDIVYKSGQIVGTGVTIDENGNKHEITLKERQTSGNDEQVLCKSGCTETGAFEDNIHVTAPGRTSTVRQEFTVDGKAALIVARDQNGDIVASPPRVVHATATRIDIDPSQ